MRNFFKSFGFAAKGLRQAVKEERNLRFHLCTAFYVYAFSLFYPFGAVEYAILTLAVAGVIALELVNSAFERVYHRPSNEEYRIAGAVKDIAAGAVLVVCIGAAICGFAFFLRPAVLGEIVRFFAEKPLFLLPLAASLAASVWFIFFYPKKPSQE